MVLDLHAAISGISDSIGDPCRDVGDRPVSDGDGTSEADGFCVVPGGAEGVDRVVGVLDADGASPDVGGGICNDCGGAGDQSVSDSGVGHGEMFGAFLEEIVFRAYPHQKLSMGIP